MTDPVVVDSSDAFENAFAEARGDAAPEPQPKEEVKEEPKQEEVKQEVAQEEQKEAPPAPDPIQELKAQLDSVTGKLSSLDSVAHGLKSLEGRYGYISKTLEEIKAAKTAAAEVSNAPTNAQIEDAFSSSEKLKSIKEDYPEWAEAMGELLAQERKRFVPPPQVDLEGFRSSLTKHLEEQFEAKLAQRERERNVELVEEVHPGWQKTVNTKDFGEWVSKQPIEVQKLGDSHKPIDAIRMLNLFAARKTDQQKKQRAAAAVTPQGDTAAPVQPLNAEDAFLGGFSSVRPS